MSERKIILGAGITGLAAGVASGCPIYESEKFPGGICSSYYLRPGDCQRLLDPPADGDAYRFEIGGGHWIFGGDEDVLEFLAHYTEVQRYERLSAIYFPNDEYYVPYPIQNHLASLPPALTEKALADIMEGGQVPIVTLADWLKGSFGTTLYEVFFRPFHKLYTAALQDEIAPQDPHKSPVDRAMIERGAKGKTPAVGYNTTFVYPEKGLNDLVKRLAEKSIIHFNKTVVAINPEGKSIRFADGDELRYDQILSTLPLDRMIEMTALQVSTPADPYTSVLVLNIGAVKGPRCPEDHWLYIPQSQAGFHRVGFYSNVDASFLPAGARPQRDRVSIYVERSYRALQAPSPEAVRAYEVEVVRELQDWGFITTAEVVDATWIPTAYTWRRPGSSWREQALEILSQHDIQQVGRYAQWEFQGIAKSIKDGLKAGLVLRNSNC